MTAPIPRRDRGRTSDKPLFLSVARPRIPQITCSVEIMTNIVIKTASKPTKQLNNRINFFIHRGFKLTYFSTKNITYTGLCNMIYKRGCHGSRMTVNNVIRLGSTWFYRSADLVERLAKRARFRIKVLELASGPRLKHLVSRPPLRAGAVHPTSLAAKISPSRVAGVMRSAPLAPVKQLGSARSR